MSSRRTILVLLAAWLAATSGALAGVVEVQVVLPTTEKISTEGISRVLVAGFRSGNHPTVDLDVETIDGLRDLLTKNTGFEVLEVEPLPLPEQPLEDAIRNTAYWQRLGRRYNADLIIGGTIDFGAIDQSGFVEVDEISEFTGQRFRRTVWVERESFKLDLGLYFFRGSSGELVYEDHLTEETMYAGKSNDDLSVLHETIDLVGEGILSILVPRPRYETRYLFTE